MKMTAATALSDLRQMQPEQWLARASAVLPPWICALLVIGLAWKLAALTWALVPSGEPKPVVPPAGADSSAAESATSPEIVQKIVAAHIFKEFKPDEVPVTPSEDFPEAQNYKLLGVYYSADDPKASIAIIVDDKSEAHVYAVGAARS
jgi:hypothetical protein